MDVSVEQIRWGRFDALRLEGARIAVVAVPEVGGKIVSLLDKATDREWLTRVPPDHLRLPARGHAWTEYDTSGWDECFPNIGPGTHPDPRLGGVALCEQGELWDRPWRVEPSDGIAMVIDGVSIPCTFRRAITVHGSQVHVAYTVSSGLDFPVEVMWAMHPLLAITPGMRIHGPRGPQRVDSAIGVPLRSDDVVDWDAFPPPAGTGRHPSEVGGRGDGFAAKLFGKPQEDAPVVEGPDGWIAFRGDAGVTDLGVWLNYGGWPEEAPLYHLAVEPSIGHADILESVVAAGRAAILPARGELAWAVDISVGGPGEPPPTHWRLP